MSDLSSDDAAAEFLDDFGGSSDDDLPLRDIAPVTNAATSATQRVGVVPGSSIATLDTKGSVVTCSFPEHPPTDMPTFNSTGASGEKDVEELYELPAVAQTIIDQKKERVALQFPDDLLRDAMQVCDWLEQRTGANIFVLGDTAYGACCVDEVAAAHYNADLLVHFGPACLAPVRGLPVHFSFGRRPLDLPRFYEAYAAHFSTTDRVLVVVAQPFAHALPEMQRVWGEHFPATVFAEVNQPGLVLPSSKQDKSADLGATAALGACPACRTPSLGKFNRPVSKPSASDSEQGCIAPTAPEPEPEFEQHSAAAAVPESIPSRTPICGSRIWRAPTGTNMDDHFERLLYVGDRDSFVMCSMMLKHTEIQFFSYKPSGRLIAANPAVDPSSDEPRKAPPQIVEETASVNKQVQARYLSIERAKEAEIFGIVVGTLSIAGHVELVRRLTSIVQKAGKKAYTLVVGKINVAKLANFAEIDMFVVVACELNSLFDNKQFYHPLITPFELELALVQGKQWTGSYDLDFTQLLAPEQKWVDAWAALPDEKGSEGGTAMVPAADRSLSTWTSPAAERLRQREWIGLNPSVAQDTTTSVREGRSGRAWEYSHPHSASARHGDKS